MATTTEFIVNLDDANKVLNEIRMLTEEIANSSRSPLLLKEQDFITQVSPKLDEATRKYQQLAAYLQEHKKGHDKDYRTIQRAFVKAMQELQNVQREAAKRREALCDADFLADGKVSTEDIQIAKEEVLEAGQIAREAVMVKELFREVGTIIYEQGKGVEQIQAKVENICIEIGRGVDELAHARQLQREARQKYLYILCATTLILAVIIIPIVLSFT